MLNRRTHLKLKQLGVIVVSWLVIGFLIAVYDHLVLYTGNSAGPSAAYSFPRSIIVNMMAGLIGALLGGTFLVFYINVRFRDKSYGYTILSVTLSFILIILIISVALRLVENPDRARLFK